MAADGNNRKRRRDDITDQQIADYLTNRASKLATKSKTARQNRESKRYSSNVNPFNDSNLNHQLFVWPKKIKRDIAASRGDGVSIKSMKKRRAELMAELQDLQKTRTEKAIQKARREEDNAVLARERARAEFHYLEKKEEEFVANQIKLRSEIRILREEGEVTSILEPAHKEAKTAAAIGTVEDGEQILGLAAEVSVYSRASQHGSQLLRKPKYFNRIHTGYEWNRYNRTHFDHENPPPKFVKGYKFTIFYPDLIDETKPPVFTIEKDGNETDTCILRFSAGPPYEDIAFRVVDKEWDRSSKKGFKSTFDGKVMHLFFNFKRCPYRR